MKKSLLITLFITILFSCAEATKKAVGMDKDNTNMTHLDSNIIYAMTIKSSCPYEVRFSDVLVDFNYESGAVDYTLYLNPWILKTGQFTIQASLLDDYCGIRPSAIEYFEIIITAEGSPEPLHVLKYSTTDHLSESWNVDLKVPYELTGWSKSVNLMEEDKSELISEVLEVYEDLKQDLNNRKIASYLAKTKLRLSEKSTYFYFKEEDGREALAENTKEYNRIKVVPFEHYTLSVESNGKIVRLVRSDKDNKGESVFRADDGDNIILYDLFLHRPKEGAPLEVIR